MKNLRARVGLLATVTGLVLLGVGAGSASATPPGSDGTHKDYVCKYVGQPGVDERLQTGDNPIWVDTAATAPGWADGLFNDAQRSYVIVADTLKMDPEPGISQCPYGDTTPHNPVSTDRTVVTTTCASSTSTVETTTTRYVLEGGLWRALPAEVTLGEPVVTSPPTAAQIAAAGLTCTTSGGGDTPPGGGGTPPGGSTSGSTPVEAPVSAPAVGASVPEAPVEVLGVTATAPAKAAVKVLAVTAATANPLPAAAGAGLADTSGQLALGGLAGLGALLAFGSAFALRRRHGVS